MPRKRQPTGQPRGRPSEDDQQLLIVMALAVLRGRCVTAPAAARLVEHRAGGAPSNRVDRLARKFQNNRRQLLQEATAIEAERRRLEREIEAERQRLERDAAALAAQVAAAAERHAASDRLQAAAEGAARGDFRQLLERIGWPEPTPDERARIMLRELRNDFSRPAGRFSPDKKPQEDE